MTAPLDIDGARPAFAGVTALPGRYKMTAGEMLVLMMLAADSFDGIECAPTLDQVAAWSGMWRSSVIAIIGGLVEPSAAGRPALLARRRQGRRTAYRLLFADPTGDPGRVNNQTGDAGLVNEPADATGDAGLVATTSRADPTGHVTGGPTGHQTGHQTVDAGHTLPYPSPSLSNAHRSATRVRESDSEFSDPDFGSRPSMGGFAASPQADEDDEIWVTPGGSRSRDGISDAQYTALADLAVMLDDDEYDDALDADAADELIRTGRAEQMRRVHLDSAFDCRLSQLSQGAQKYFTDRGLTHLFDTEPTPSTEPTLPTWMRSIDLTAPAVALSAVLASDEEPATAAQRDRLRAAVRTIHGVETKSLIGALAGRTESEAETVIAEYERRAATSKGTK